MIRANKSRVLAAAQYIAEKNIKVSDIDSFAQNSERLFDAYFYTLSAKIPVGIFNARTLFAEQANRTVEDINALHDEKDSIRFKSVEGASAEKLFLLASYGEEEAYTTSFNGLFNRLVAKLSSEEKSGHTLLSELKFDHARNFIRECAEYNRLNDFLATMPTAQQEELLTWFVEDLSSENEKIQEEGSTIANVVATINDSRILKIFGKSIEKKYRHAIEVNDKKRETAYGLLGSLFKSRTYSTDTFFRQMNEKYQIEPVATLSHKELANSNGVTVERSFFYKDGDGDGQRSFESFLADYQKDKNWHFEDRGTYVVFNSLKGERVLLLANKPDEEEAGGKAINDTLAAQNLKIKIAIHRGHSYHALKTINNLTPDVRITILGSCGGYRMLSEVLNHAPQTQILSTKGVGARGINGPMLKFMTGELCNGRDLNWQEMWAKLKVKFKNDPRFDNYIRPDKNLSFMFIRAYNQFLAQAEEAK